MRKRTAVIIAAPIIGAVLGYLVVMALNNGWFHSRWQTIEKPPGETIHLAALSQDSLWVQSDSGAIYYNENSSTCKSDCWREVPEIPALPIIEPDESRVTGEACAPSLPLSWVIERISECRSTMWVDYNFTFALRMDGTISLWQADLYKEWAVVLLFLGVCGGAIALFIPALLIGLILGLLDWRASRAKKNTGIITSLVVR